MCTATWIAEEDGYELFFNRDELLTRGRERPPKNRVSGGVRYVAPSDSDSGGTWIGVNDRGVTLCILNYYPERDSGGLFGSTATLPLFGRRKSAAPVSAESPGSDEESDDVFESRGVLLRSLLNVTSLDELTTRLVVGGLARYRPFTILGFELGPSVLQCRWHGGGEDLEVDTVVSPPVSSSSFKTRDVLKARREAYEALLESWKSPHGAGPTASFLLSYHKSHVPEKGPCSVCMHREDGKTRSFSHVKVSCEAAQFFYTSGSPCESEPFPPVRVSIVRAPSDASTT